LTLITVKYQWITTISQVTTNGESKMSQKGETFLKNHFVPKGDPDYMVESFDSYKITFEKLHKMPDGEIKYARASVNCAHKQFMEIIDKYGLQLSDRWQVWQKGIDGKKGKNIPFNPS